MRPLQLQVTEFLMRRLLAKSVFNLAVLISVAALLGCKSHSPSQYVSPRVEGRVLDAQSRQPIQGVLLRRVVSDGSDRSLDPQKGGEIMMRPAPIRTAGDGTFVVESKRDLVLFRSIGWYSITLAFEQNGYRRLTTNYTMLVATNTAKGEPLVKAGDLLLMPLSK